MTAGKNPDKLDIVITGMGVVCALGENPEQFAAALKAGKRGIDSVEQLDLPVRAAALLQDFSVERSIDKLAQSLPAALIERARVVVRRQPLVVQTAVHCAMQAWSQAGKSDADRIGLVVAGQNTSSRYACEQQQRHGDDLSYLPASFGLQCLDTHVVGCVSEILPIRGPGFTIGGASASGNMGVIQACQLIQTGLVDRCVVIGALADVSRLELQAWKNLGAAAAGDLPASQCCRPFDSAHGGFVYGQGSACLVLERGQYARRRGAEALAWLTGLACNLDGNRSADPSARGEALAMRRALQMAGLSAADVAYVNTHGSASALGDETEMEALKEVFGRHFNATWLNATKGLTGHCLYAAGLIEAVATVLQMRHGFLHPNANLEQPIDTDARFVGDSAVAAAIPVALSNSFGFGGINSAIVLQQLG